MDLNQLYTDAYEQALATRPTSAFQGNIASGDNLYNRLREQAATNRQIADSSLQKRMADLGVSSAPMTTQIRDNMAGLANAGAITNQQQTFNDRQDFLSGYTGAQSDAQMADIYAKLGAQKNAEELAMQNASLNNDFSIRMNDISRDAARTNLETNQAFQRQMEDAAREAEKQQKQYDAYYQLYLSRKMTAKQFKALTGIEVTAWGSGKKKTNPNDFMSGAPSSTQMSLPPLASLPRFASDVDAINEMVDRGLWTPEQAKNAYNLFNKQGKK